MHKINILQTYIVRSKFFRRHKRLYM